MRRISHRLLTAFPTFLIAILGLLAAANPAGALARLTGFAELMSNPSFFWFCVAIVVAYFVLWWLTSLEPKSRRIRIQSGLRPFYEKLTGFQHSFETANTLDDVAELLPEFDRTLAKAGEWISANMTAAAFQKFKSPKQSSLEWSWPGDGKSSQRSRIVVLNRARLDVLDTFLLSDGWDGDPPPVQQRMMAKIKAWKDRKTPSTSL